MVHLYQVAACRASFDSPHRPGRQRTNLGYHLKKSMPCWVLFQITKIQVQNSHPHDVFDHLLMDHGMISPRDILQQQAAARPQQLATMQRSQIGERMDRAQGRKAARRSQPSACTPVGETATQSLRLAESASKVPSVCASIRNAGGGGRLFNGSDRRFFI